MILKMKIEKIEYSRLFAINQGENVVIGVDGTFEEGDNLESVVRDLSARIEKLQEELFKDKKDKN